MVINTGMRDGLAFEEEKEGGKIMMSPNNKAMSTFTDDIDIQLMNIDEEDELFEDAKDEFIHQESGEQIVKSKRFFFEDVHEERLTLPSFRDPNMRVSFW